MKSIARAWRRIRKMREGQMLSILSLAAGLSIALLLFLKVQHELSYNRSIKDASRIYILETRYKQKGEDWTSGMQVPGAIAPAMAEAIPSVEIGTRTTALQDGATLYDADGNPYVATISLADKYFFDLLQWPVLKGDAKQVLDEPGKCMISEKLAKKMGGEVLGKMLSIKTMPNMQLEVAGVYKTFPSNVTLGNDVYVSMTSYSKKSYENWLGNDRYKGYVRLSKDASVKDVEDATKTLLEKNVNMDEVRAFGGDLYFALKPFDSIVQSMPLQKRLLSILTIVAISLLFTSLINYLLLRVSNTMNRQRQLLLERSLGAPRRSLWLGEFSETILLVLIAILIGATGILLAHKHIAKLIDNEVLDLLRFDSLTLTFLVLIFLLCVVSYIPVRRMLNLPLRDTISGHNASRSFWRRAFIAFELVFAGLLSALLCLVMLQYNGMTNTDQGYKYEGLYSVNINGMDKERLPAFVEALRNKPWQEGVTLSSMLPYTTQSGDNLIDPVTKKELFNLCDFFDVDTAFFRTMQIKIVESHDSMNHRAEAMQLLLSESAAEKLAEAMNWKDGVLGKEILLTSYGVMPILGVYADIATIRTNVDPYPTKMPSAMVYNRTPDSYYNHLTIRIPSNKPEYVDEFLAMANELLPTKDLVLHDVENSVYRCYEGQKRMRDTIWIGAGVALLMALLGLVAYQATELGRRKRELAIRRVLGAGLSGIVWQMIKELRWVLLPSIVLGVFLGYRIGKLWQAGFSYKAPLPLVLFIGLVLFLLALVIGVIAIKVYNAQRKPAARDIRSE